MLEARAKASHLAGGLILLAALCHAGPARADDRPIQDNSFLVEEAYNQEPGVVQHINGFTRTRGSDAWAYTFTQEWPVRGLDHQLSYSLSLLRTEDRVEPENGIGDSALHYRYQLAGSGETRIAVAPRLSALLPTGSERRGLGTGAYGLQVNLPVSVSVSERWVAHANLGSTYLRRAGVAGQQRTDLTTWHTRGSVIWLARPRFNVMAEVDYTLGDDDSLVVNPGIRWAHDFASGLQIVPGVSIPIGLGPSRGEESILFYLSFEHPWGRSFSSH